MVAYTIAQTIGAILYMTGYNARVMASMLPELISDPVILTGDTGRPLARKDEHGAIWLKCQLGQSKDWYRVIGDSFRIKKGVVPNDPSDALKWAVTNLGEAFILQHQKEGRTQYTWVSPLLGVKLGDGTGGQLNLYSEVMYRYLLLAQSWRGTEDKVWAGEWAQWVAAHSKVLRSQLRGEETREAISGLVAKATRAKGAYSAKVGAYSARIPTKKGKKTISPGAIYVSTENPLARLAGHTAFMWRNPVLVLQFPEIISIGPATVHCQKPTWETEKPILPNTKVYLHPLDPSITGGDVDGDGMQFVSLQELLRWALRNWHVMEKWPGLQESIIHHFLEEK